MPPRYERGTERLGVSGTWVPAEASLLLGVLHWLFDTSSGDNKSTMAGLIHSIYRGILSNDLGPSTLVGGRYRLMNKHLGYLLLGTCGEWGEGGRR